MAEYCPNPSCKHKMKITDWRQNCPGCGVNVLYYGIDERLDEEADRVELDAAKTQKKFDRAKAAAIGSKLAVLRFIVLFLPLPALLLPLGKLSTNMVGEHEGITFTLNAINIFKNIGVLQELFGVLGGNQALWFALMAVGLALVVLMTVAGLAVLIMSNGPKGFLRNSLISIAGMTGAALFVVSFIAVYSHSQFFLETEASPFIIAPALAFAVILIINIVIKKQGGIPVNYKECFIAGIPEAEVLAFIEKGGTVKELREQREREKEQAAEA